MNTYIALLRAVNVTGTLRIEALHSLCTQAVFKQARTYSQS